VGLPFLFINDHQCQNLGQIGTTCQHQSTHLTLLYHFAAKLTHIQSHKIQEKIKKLVNNNTGFKIYSNFQYNVVTKSNKSSRRNDKWLGDKL
jgi:thiamine pyrophosphokinase